MQVEYPLEEYVPAEHKTELVVHTDAPEFEVVPEPQEEHADEDGVEE